MVVTCDIEFDNNIDGIYLAGQEILGTITIKADKAKEVDSVVVKIQGTTTTAWTETSDKSNSLTTKSIDYSGEEEYLNSVKYLLKTTESKTVIEPGIQVHNFAFYLPTRSPSSFEGLYGRIRYTIQVILSRPWKCDKIYTKGFTVLDIVDLNYDSPLLKIPINTEIQKVFGCGPCKSQPLRVDLHLLQAGYVCGQEIPVKVTINNANRVEIDQIELRLTMLITYSSQIPNVRSKTDNLVLCEVTGRPTGKQTRHTVNYVLVVPPTPPTGHSKCHLIQFDYRVELLVKVKGFHKNQVIYTPITIGNVPLFTVIQQQPRSCHQSIGNFSAFPWMNHHVMELNRNNILTKSMPWTSSDTIPLPDFRSGDHILTAKLQDDNNQEFGETFFHPKYPVFRLDQAPALETVPTLLTREPLKEANGNSSTQTIPSNNSS